MMRAKIAVYTQGQAAASRLFAQEPGSLAAQYGDAQASYLYGNLAAALAKADALIKAQPKNAYFQELRGDILMKANRPKDAAEAYANAVRLDPARSGMLPVSYGQALMAVGTPEFPEKGSGADQQGSRARPRKRVGYRYLAQAYGELGNIPEAELATAEGHFYSGAYKDAKIFAMRAQMKMKRGEPGWIRAQDIINYKHHQARKSEPSGRARRQVGPIG